jgi:hypothetical protein
MATERDAAAVIDGLHRKHTWEGLSAPMVVERCCAARLGVKAATQHATRARRTALAAAARRAVRTHSTGWDHDGLGSSAALMGMSGAAATLSALGLAGSHHHHMLGASGPLAALSSHTVPNLMALQQAAAAHAQAQAHSAPLPLLRSMSGPQAGAHPPGLYATAGPYGGSPPVAAGLMASAAMLSAPLAAMSGGYDARAAPPPPSPEPPAPSEPLCSVALQTPEQLSLVCDHAVTLSALSGAAFWLQPPPAGGGATAGLALSGTPAQVSAAVDLMSQLLVRGASLGAAAAAAAAASSAMCWP